MKRRPKLHELLNLYSNREIVNELVLLYPDEEENREGYYEALNELRKTEPLPKTPMKIVLVYGIDTEREKYIEVLGRNVKNEVWSIVFAPWNEWLGMAIETNIVMEQRRAIAYCLFEMTFYGYSNKKIQKEWEEIVEKGDAVISSDTHRESDEDELILKKEVVN